MLIEKKSGHRREIIPAFGQVLYFCKILISPGVRNMKIGNVPVFDQMAKRGGCFEPGKLAQAFYGKNVRGLEFLIFTLKFGIGLINVLFVGNGKPFSLFKIQEMKGGTFATLLLTQNFPFDDGGLSF